MEQTRWLNESEQHAWHSLQFMQTRLTAELARELSGDSKLSYPDYIVLVALTGQVDGRLRIFEVANQIGWEKSRLSHHVGRMSHRGLVTREQCDSDRRGAFVVVTSRGREEIAAAAPGHIAAVRRLFIDTLTPEQLHVITTVAEMILAKLATSDSQV